MEQSEWVIIHLCLAGMGSMIGLQNHDWRTFVLYIGTYLVGVLFGIIVTLEAIA